MIYLNSAATSFPRPQNVLDAINHHLTHPPVDISRSTNSEHPNLIEQCRAKIAQFFNISDYKRLFFTSGATASINYALRGLYLENAHIITTAFEHNSVVRPLMELQKEKNFSFTFLENPLELEKAIGKKTKLVLINHSSNVTGETFDIKTIGKIAQKNKLIFMVDASQSAGIIPIDVIESHIDILVFTGHKSLYGLPGTGGIYINDQIELEPTFFGGTGSYSENLNQPRQLPYYYESGSLNTLGIIALKEGISFIEKTGIQNIYQHKIDLVDHFISQMQREKEIEIYTSKNPICCFNIKKINADDVGFILEQSFGIITRTGLHCAPLAHQTMGTFPHGAIRVAPSFFNTKEEIDRLVIAIKNIIESVVHGSIDSK